jgi:hypothetical protein
MCLIIHKPSERQIDPEFLRQAWRQNPDGWGGFHLQDGQPVWAKGLALEELVAWNAVLPAGTEAYLHLRQATYGHVNQAMAHPFVVREGLMLMHNGSIQALAPDDPAISDSAELARLLGDMLAGLNAEQASSVLRSEGFARLFQPLVGGSRVVLLDSAGAIRLGQGWHTVAHQEWNAAMHGIQVSNTHAWRSRCAAAQAGRARAWLALGQRWLASWRGALVNLLSLTGLRRRASGT